MEKPSKTETGAQYRGNRCENQLRFLLAHRVGELKLSAAPAGTIVGTSAV